MRSTYIHTNIHSAEEDIGKNREKERYRQRDRVCKDCGVEEEKKRLLYEMHKIFHSNSFSF